MRIIFVATLATLAASSTVFAAGKDSLHVKASTTWNVSLDAEGHVVKLEQTSHVKPLLSEPLERAIRSWEFLPGHVDGVAAATETTLQVGITLDPVGEKGYAVRVDSVNMGGGFAKTNAPHFPASALRGGSKGMAALAVVEARYDEAGKVIAAELAPGAPKVDRAIGNAAVKSVQGWTFQPESVGGHGLAATVYVPICFTVAPQGNKAPDCPSWTPPGAHVAVADGGSFAPEPAATLKSDVIGHTL